MMIFSYGSGFIIFPIIPDIPFPTSAKKSFHFICPLNLKFDIALVCVCVSQTVFSVLELRKCLLLTLGRAEDQPGTDSKLQTTHCPRYQPREPRAFPAVLRQVQCSHSCRRVQKGWLTSIREKRKELSPCCVITSRCYLTMCMEKQRRELLSFALIAFCWNCFRRQKWHVGAEIKKKKKLLYSRIYTSSSTERVRDVCCFCPGNCLSGWKHWLLVPPSLGGGKGLRNWVNVTFPSYTANREPSQVWASSPGCSYF